MISTYRRHFSPFHCAATCSHWGHFFSLFVLAWLLVRMPFIRLFSARKILHIHFASYGSFTRKSLVMRWGKLLGFKVIGHCHGGAFKQFSQQRGKDKISKKLHNCDVIIALSESWKSFFSEEMGCERVKVANNPIERANNIENNVSDKLELLFLGRIGALKGIFDVVDVIAHHKEEFAGKLHLTIGGDGEISALTNRIDNAQVGDIVEYAGWVSGDTKEALLRKTNVVVLTSHKEGLPLIILEAMAHGKGVIATPVGGIPEIISDGENGLLVHPGNTEEIYKSIVTYINDNTLARRQGEISLKRIEPFYPENVKAELVKIYSSLISK